MKVKEIYVEVDYSIKRRNRFFLRRHRGDYLLKIKGLVLLDSNKNVIAHYNKFEDEERYLFKREIEELSHKHIVKIVSSNIYAIEMITNTYNEFPFYLKEDPFETFHKEVESLGWRRLQKIDPTLSKNKRKFSLSEKYEVVTKSDTYLSSSSEGIDKDCKNIFKRAYSLVMFHRYIKKHLQRK